MKKFMKIWGLIIIALIMVFSFVRCEPLEDEFVSVKVTMKNKSTDNVHMWTKGETIDPSNKLSPNGSRTHSFIINAKPKEPWAVEIHAGRDGATLDTYTYVGERSSADISIRFTSAGILEEGS